MKGGEGGGCGARDNVINVNGRRPRVVALARAPASTAKTRRTRDKSMADIICLLSKYCII